MLALVLLADLFLFVIFIPANNQIGLSRPATIGFLTLVLLYVLGPPRSGKRAAQGRVSAGRQTGVVN